MSQGQRFAVVAKPRQEQVAKVNLKRQGYHAVLPLIEARKRRENKWTTVTEPLFSGYLFVQLVLGKDNLAPIRSTLGCRDLVRIGSSLLLVPDAVMTLLLSLSAPPKTRKTPSAGFQGIFKLTMDGVVRKCLSPCWARKERSRSRWTILLCHSHDLSARRVGKISNRNNCYS
jgi:transcription antitermination factor NusG